MAGRLYIPPLDPERLLPGLQLQAPLLTAANMAPRRFISQIRLEDDIPCLSQAFWGLTPAWLNVLDQAPHCARAESLDTRPMFREAFASRRSLVPVGGIYLWQAQPRFKQPYLVTRVDRGPLMLAGLWSRYHTTPTEFTDSAALVTVPSNVLMAPLSDRLPAVINADDALRWLDPDTSLEDARAMLRPAALELLGAFPVSRRVNDPANQDGACAHPTGPMRRWQEQET